MTEWISTKKAMQLLGVGSTTIKRWTNNGRLPFTRTAGGHRRFKVSEVERFMQSQGEGADESADTQEWLHWLQQKDVRFIREQVLQLYETRGDWFTVSDFLSQVQARISRCWANGESSLVEEHMLLTKLGQAITAVATSLPLKRPAPVCLLATLTGEKHAFGLCLPQLCTRSAGIDGLIAGYNMDPTLLNTYIADSDHEMLALSASAWRTDRLSLTRNYQDIAANCRKLDITLFLCGEGAWPDEVDYGHRCYSFVNFGDVLGQLGIGLQRGQRLTNSVNNQL